MTSPPKKKRPADEEEEQAAAVEGGGGPPQPSKDPPPPKKPASMASAWSSVFAGAKKNALAAASAAQVAGVLLVLDLEATCAEERGSINPQETIEIGVVAVELKHPRGGGGGGGHSGNGAAAAAGAAAPPPTTHKHNNPQPQPPRLPRLLGPEFTFHSYARPTEHPRLTEFCINLTGVQQQQVDGAPLISDVLAAFERWLDATGLSSRRLLAVTWTSFDLGALLGRELVWRKLPCPAALRNFSDLKRLFGQNQKKLFGLSGMAPRLKEALTQAGLEWQGREHSALDDALNTARLAMLLVERGVKIEPTGVAAGCAGDAADEGKEHHHYHHHHHPQQQQQQHEGSEAAAAAGAAVAGAAGGAPPPPPPKPHHPPQQRQLTLAPEKPPPPAFDPQTKRWLGRCRCGVDAQKRTVRRPGPTNGKSFFSCGKWTMASGKGECDFFLWQSDVPPGSTLPAERSRFGGKKKSSGAGGR